MKSKSCLGKTVGSFLLSLPPSHVNSAYSHFVFKFWGTLPSMQKFVCVWKKNWKCFHLLLSTFDNFLSFVLTVLSFQLDSSHGTLFNRFLLVSLFTFQVIMLLLLLLLLPNWITLLDLSE
jgi:hypothetical protein